jgi:hypothetical protein
MPLIVFSRGQARAILLVSDRYTRDSKNVSFLTKAYGLRTNEMSAHTIPSPRVLNIWWSSSVRDVAVKRYSNPSTFTLCLQPMHPFHFYS